MATVSIDLAGLSTSFTLDEADATRILTAYTAMYTTQDEEGVDVVPTPSETVNQLADGVVQGLAANAVRWEQTAASTAAIGGVPPITATIN
tara:strand:- start:563 stop:835 length:273 start_codon:yes stop_codon:yes gene_type:complete